MTMLFSLIPPFVYQYYINKVVSDKKLECMINVIVGYSILFIMQSFVISLGKYLETKYSNSLRLNLKNQVFNIYSKMSYTVFEKEDIGEMRLRAEEDIEIICRFYIDYCLNFFFCNYLFGLCIRNFMFLKCLFNCFWKYNDCLVILYNQGIGYKDR